jgi:hypothetical protein
VQPTTPLGPDQVNVLLLSNSNDLRQRIVESLPEAEILVKLASKECPQWMVVITDDVKQYVTREKAWEMTRKMQAEAGRSEKGLGKEMR